MDLRSLENRLRFKHLALLRYLHTEGSVHKAAAKLHMSQPAASKLLREMESLFGCTLFVRSSSGLIPSPSGIMLLEHAEAILTEIELAQTEVSAKEAENPIIRIGASVIAVQMELQPVLPRFHKLYPTSQVRIVEGRTAPLLELLKRGKIDLALGLLSAFTLREDTLRGLSHRLIRQEEWVVFASQDNALARKRKVSLEELQRCKWVLPPQDSLIRTAFEQAFHSRGLSPPQPYIEVLPFTTMLSIMRSSDMVTIAPRSAISMPENVSSLSLLKIDLKVDIPPMAVFCKQAMLKRSPVRAMLDLLSSPPA